MKVLLIAIVALLPLAQVHAQTIRPLSRGWYRLPYADNTVLQGPGNNLFEDGHNGHDIIGTPYKAWDDPSPHRIVAMADGVVVEVVDVYDGCGLFPDSTGRARFCNNYIWIDHLNGEFSAYWHVAIGSSQVDSGDVVSAGDWIADEGDVGSTGSTDVTYNRPKQGCDGTEDHTDDEVPNCGMHLHFAVTDRVLYEMVPSVNLHARICGIETHVLLKNPPNSTCVPCNIGACVSDTVIAEWYGNDLRAIVADNSVTTSGEVIIGNSVVGFQAGTYITLYPGFSARAGSYFRAEIGTCER